MSVAKSKPASPAAPGSFTPRETADYMADMTLQFCQIAKNQGFDSLAGLYEKAFYEAAAKANPIEIPADEWQEFQALSAKRRS